jgi:hypothetical protein
MRLLPVLARLSLGRLDAERVHDAMDGWVGAMQAGDLRAKTINNTLARWSFA